MGRRLILDTNILIAYERGTIDRSGLDDDELAVASVTIAEYRTGIELADTPERAAARARALATITRSSPCSTTPRSPPRTTRGCSPTSAGRAARAARTT